MVKYAVMSPLNKLHAKLGDFWWYSLMLFLACRAADALAYSTLRYSNLNKFLV